MKRSHPVDAFSMLPEILAARARSERLLIGLDFDGTLAAIVPEPGDARLAEGAAAVLERLEQRADTTLAVVTGRGVTDARARVGMPAIHYAGNHGLEMEGPSHAWIHPEASSARGELDKLIMDIRETLGSRNDITIEDKLVSASVHFRSVDDPAEQANIIAAVHSAFARNNAGLRLMDGKRVVEIRPAVRWDKGRAFAELRTRTGHDDAPAIFIGDDVTDEDAFRELTHAGDVAIIVGEARDRETCAHALLHTVGDVVRFLDGLAS